MTDTTQPRAASGEMARAKAREVIPSCDVATCPPEEFGTSACCRHTQVLAFTAALRVERDAERERCAKIAENRDAVDWNWACVCNLSAQQAIAAAIRNPEPT